MKLFQLLANALSLRQLLYTLAVLLGVVILTFFIRPPGDPVRVALGQHADSVSVANLQKQLGLDKPLAIQMLHYIGNLTAGDMGRSLVTGRPVAETIADRLPATALLATTSMLIATVLGIILGV